MTRRKARYPAWDRAFVVVAAAAAVGLAGPGRFAVAC